MSSVAHWKRHALRSGAGRPVRVHEVRVSSDSRFTRLSDRSCRLGYPLRPCAGERFVVAKLTSKDDVHMQCRNRNQRSRVGKVNA